MTWLNWHFRKPLSFIILYIVVLAFGIISIKGLQFSISPGAFSPVISIKTQYFGMDSEYIEKNITIPIENALSSIKGIQNISSVSEEGESIISLSVDPKRNIKYATLEIKSTVDTVAASFPNDVQESVISHYDPSQMPVMILSFYPQTNSTSSLMEIRHQVSTFLKPVLQRVDGVAEIIVTGGKQKEIVVVANTQQILSSGMQLQDLNHYLQQNNESFFLGNLEENNESIPIYSHGKYNRILDLDKIAIKTFNSNEGRFQSLEQLADIDFHHKRVDSISRINGAERVSLYIQSRSGANVLDLCRRIRQSFMDNRSDNYAWEIDFDKSREVSESLVNLILSIVIGIILLMLLVIPFIKDIRMTLITLIPIPLSLSGTFILANLFHIELNAVILTGIALGTGLLVDNGLIIVEFLHKRDRKKGLAHIVSVVKELRAPLASSFLTTLCVFIPLLLSSVEIRYMYFGFSVILFILLGTSLFLAMGPVPLAFYALKKDDNTPHIQPRFIRVLNHSYVRLLKKIQVHQGLWKSISMIVLVFSIVAVLLKGYGTAGSDGVEEFSAYVEPVSGTSLEKTDEITKELEKLLLADKRYKKIISKVEKAHSSLILRFHKPLSKKRFEKYLEELKLQTRQKIETFVYYSYGDSASGDTEINIQLIGEDIDRIKELAHQASGILYQSPAFSDVILRFKDDDPVYQLYPDYSKIQLNELSVQNIIDESRIYLYGVISTKFNPQDQGILDVRILSKDAMDDSIDLESFLDLKIRNPQGDLIPLGQLVQVTNMTRNSKIYRINKRRAFTITARLKSKYSLSQGLDIISRELKALKTPQGYYWQFDNKYEKLRESNRKMLIAIILAVFFTFITLVILYENIRKSAVTLLAIPFVFTGTALALFLFSYSMTTPIYIALILLAGITVNNSVLILNDLRDSMLPIQVMHSSRGKLNSIILTTLSTISSILPMLFTPGSGAYLWRPFAVTIIFGLITSTVFTLLVIPFYVKVKGEDGSLSDD